MVDRFRSMLGAAVCVVALDAHALSMGASRGEAVVGQVLDLSFDITLDAGADAASSCVAADLFYGETRIDPARVRVSARQGPQPLQATVQLVSNVVVNEPVVSVQLRAGCGTAISRRYVLLASSPVESTAPAAPAVLSARPLVTAPEAARPATREAAGTVAPTRRPAAPARAQAPSASPSTAPKPRSSTRPVAPRKAPVPVEKPETAAAPAADAGRSTGGARLELQSPGDWVQEQNLPLRSSDAMANPALTTTVEQRATAAALWRALNATEGAPPTDNDAQQRVEALEAQLKTLQNGARMARGRENDLQVQLNEAQQGRDLAWLILWPVVALLVLALIALAFVVWRVRTGRRGIWWRPKQHASAFGADATVLAEGFVDTQPAPVEYLYPPDAPEAGAPIGHSVSAERPVSHLDSEPAFAPSRQPGAEPLAPTSAEAAMRAARELRSGSANELADVQQNADFFASLGQYDQAIELLQGYIASHPGTSPVAYLDLLKLFHTLSLTDPYRKLRGDFNAVFNAEVPPFASFLKTTRDLSGYTDVLQRIAEAWPRPDVLDLIESFLIRHAGEGSHPPFQLEAYRDLLMLYEIAKATHGVDGDKLTAPPAGLTGFTPSAPLSPSSVSFMPAAGAASAMAMADPVGREQNASVDFVLEPEPAMATNVAPPFYSLPSESRGADLGVPLDFAAPSNPPHPSLDDIALPDLDPPGRTAAPPAGDTHLIDFDMFDVAVPPPDNKPKT
ncbi:hypothetical protein [Xylophilus sp. GOD-11R]|uniref:hypothetical protein n=1 Tax=Xylophilus sp. GOD-11R TaxID=3089814 RepID=UPI00298C06BF|nr:hypothetical protein [Xylophilus sp. GOD-11R]WPB58214.1 hypothetical protein R9X41_06120 [Xylophilus sp. GOD-11R]